MNIAEKTCYFAVQSHNHINQKYDGKEYGFHLQMVVDEIKFYNYLLRQEDHDLAEAGGWAHDLLEDCGAIVSYNDLKKVTNKEVAEISFALQTGKGRNRKERHCKKYYMDIMQVHLAPYIKICDRIANVKYSKNTNNSMFKTYKQENAEFSKYFQTYCTEKYVSIMLHDLKNLFESLIINHK